jgi:hypothetical protein
MTAMTNRTLPEHGPTLSPALLALAPVGGRQRPAKVVEHPAYRAARGRVGLDAPVAVLRLPIVSLNTRQARTATGCEYLTRMPGVA